METTTAKPPAHGRASTPTAESHNTEPDRVQALELERLGPIPGSHDPLQALELERLRPIPRPGERSTVGATPDNSDAVQRRVAEILAELRSTRLPPRGQVRARAAADTGGPR